MTRDARPIRPSRRLGGLLLALFSLGLTAVMAGQPAVAVPTTDPVSPVPPVTSLRIVTYNVSAEQPVENTVSDLNAIAAEAPDVIALQEMASPERRRAVRAALVDCETCVYDAWIPGTAVSAGTPILYRSDKFTLLEAGSEQVTEDTYVGPRGAGPSTIRAKWVNWVRLYNVTTNRQFSVINNHFVPSVQAKSGGPNDLRPRVAIYRKHMTALVGIITRLKTSTRALVITTGDFNVNYRQDRVVQAKMFPYRALGSIAVRSSFQNLYEPAEGTHVLTNGFSKRLIDYVLHQYRKWVTPVDHRILFGLSSDHRPLVSDYTLYGRACFEGRRNIC